MRTERKSTWRRSFGGMVLALAMLGGTAGAAQAETLLLTPSADERQTGSRHIVQATVEDDLGNPIPSVPVEYTIRGANPGLGTVTTSSTGNARITWTGAESGTDTLEAYADLDGDSVQDAGEPEAEAEVDFSYGTLTLSGPTSVQAGATASQPVRLVDGNGTPIAGTVRWRVDGTNAASGSVTTNASGNGTIRYSADEPGQDLLTAWYDGDGTAGQSADDPQDTLSIDVSFGRLFLTVPGVVLDAGGQGEADVEVTDGAGAPVDSRNLNWVVTGANPGSGLVRTNENGRTTVKWPVPNPGRDTLSVFFDSDGVAGRSDGDPQDEVAFLVVPVIRTAGPLTHVYGGDDLWCQARYGDDVSPQFFGGLPSSCGTFLWQDDQSFGPERFGGTPFTRLGQTPVSGEGTTGDPFRITTRVCAGVCSGAEANGTEIEHVITYVTGREFYRTDLDLIDRRATGAARDTALYQYADCYLQDSDAGYGYRDPETGGVYCTENPNNSPSARIEGFVPATPGSHNAHGSFSVVRSLINGEQLPDTCECTELLDNGMALSWAVRLAPGERTRRSFLTAFSPTGVVVDATPPPVAIGDPTPTGETTETRPTVGGTAGDRPGDAIAIDIEIREGASDTGRLVQAFSAQRSGTTWQATVPEPLAPGTYTAIATQAGTGPSGRTTRVFTVVAPVTPPVVPPVDPRPPVGDKDRDGVPDDQDTSDASVPPVVAKTVLVRVEKGTVLIKRPASRSGARASQGSRGFVPLKGAEVIPVGSTLDASNGRLALTSAAGTRAGVTQSSDFYSGVFQVRQQRARRATTELRVQTSSSRFRRLCGKRLPAYGSSDAVAAQRRRVVSRLWGNGRGRFRTRGRHSAATVRGTIWLTEERCDGTLTRVRRGKVAVRDFRANRTVTVTAGKSFLARAQRAASRRNRG